jgi:hypothetical protein
MVALLACFSGTEVLTLATVGLLPDHRGRMVVHIALRIAMVFLWRMLSTSAWEVESPT